jgi:hypothetical protein
MKEYNCEECGKNFKQKCHWINHTQNKKYPCVKVQLINNSSKTGSTNGSIHGSNSISNMNINMNINTINELQKKKISCKFCLKDFLYTKNLNKHIREERCEVLKIQKQQKENIFVNLLEEEKIVNQTKKELKDLNINDFNTKKKNNDIESNNQMDYLITQIKLLNDKLELQKKESEIKIEKQQLQFQKEIEQQKSNTENRLKLMTDRYGELDKKHNDVIKINEKLQTKMNKIVNKNKITNNTTNSNNNITNTVINNPTIKLVNFGSEDLSKISHNVFIDTIKSQGAGLYNRAIDGIHFNKDYPENQNIYISDINRGKVMIYKNEKWIIDNWDNIFPDLLDKVVQFGYDKEQFLADCNYKLNGKTYNKQMIKNGIRWYKLLSEDEPDIDYFTLDPEDRPEIDDDTYNDYVEMQEFRKKHPKKVTEFNIKNKVKLNMYNKREIPIDNFKKIELDSKQNVMIEN